MMRKKAKSGTKLGMKSVKAGYDRNPNVTRADIIVAAKKKAKKGKTVKKAQAGGVASKAKKAPMVDAKGAWTKVQERTIAGKKVAKKGASVKKAKTGAKMTKCKYGCK